MKDKQTWEKTTIGLCMLAYRKHSTSGEDSRWQCPKNHGGKCNCGADAHNQVVLDAFAQCYREHGIFDVLKIADAWDYVKGEK